MNKQVRLALCLLQHITSSCCLLGLFSSVLVMGLAGHGCQLQNYDRGPSTLFIEMSHWAKMAYSWDRCMDGWIMDGETEERNATAIRVSPNWRFVPMHTSEAWAKSPSLSEDNRTSFLKFYLVNLHLTGITSLKYYVWRIILLPPTLCRVLIRYLNLQVWEAVHIVHKTL